MKNLREWNIIECGINGDFYATPATGAEKNQERHTVSYILSQNKNL